MKKRQELDSSDSSEDSQAEEDVIYNLRRGFKEPIGFSTPIKGVSREFRQKRVTSRQFEEGTLNRFDQYEKRKKEKILVQKKEVMQSEMRQYTATPAINKQKKRDASRNPLVNRLDEILQNKKIRIENKREKFMTRAEIEARECTFKPNINSGATNRSVEDLFKWNQQKKVRLMEKSMEQDMSNNRCSFTPEISNQSRKMMKKRTHNKEFQRVEDRLMGYIKKNQQNKEEDEHDRSVGMNVSARSKSVKDLTAGRSAMRGLKAKKDIMDVSSFVLQENNKNYLKNVETFKPSETDSCEKELQFSFKKFKDESPMKDKSTPQLKGAKRADYSSDEESLAASSYHPTLSNTQKPVQSKPIQKVSKVNKENMSFKAASKPSFNSNASTSNTNLPPKQPLKGSNVNVKTTIPEPIHSSHMPTYNDLNKVSVQTDNSWSVSNNNQSVQTKKTSINDKVKRSLDRSGSQAQSRMSAMRQSQQTLVSRAHEKKSEAERSLSTKIKSKKEELTEKYGVKVKKQGIDCKDIQRSILTGDTTSMLQNLKRVNTQLRKINDLECIIKDPKTSSSISTANLGSGSGQSEERPIISVSIDLKQFDVQTPVPSTPQPGKNPFIELFEENAFCPIN